MLEVRHNRKRGGHKNYEKEQDHNQTNTRIRPEF